MTEDIVNPRRAPRIPVHCTVRIGLRSGSYVASRTADLAPGGCGVETTFRAPPGERAFVEVRDERVPGSHLLSGRVAWSSVEAPWRCGIAFDEGCREAARALFAQLAAAYPDAAARSEPVERIPADALLTPVPVPGGLAAVLPAEVEILHALRGGVEARELRATLGERWDRCINPLFALVQRGAIDVRSGSR